MNKLAFCGNDCSVCPRYTATEKGEYTGQRNTCILILMGFHRVVDRLLYGGIFHESVPTI